MSYPVRCRSHRCLCLVGLVVTLVIAACSGKQPQAPRDSGSAWEDAGYWPSPLDASDQDAASTPIKLVIAPALAMLTIDSERPDAMTFTAMPSHTGGSQVPVRWSIDKPELGSIDPETGSFKPTGVAGKITITARAGSLSGSMTIELVVAGKLDGDPDSGKVPAGAGGLGGVGGDGGGSQISDPQLKAALDKPATIDPELRWLYPYDGTVWPRGLPAPLLQWRHGAHAAQAVKLRIEVAPSFSADVYLGRPPGLAAGQPIVRLPIPQVVWRNALKSGSSMKVTLTIAASDGAGGYAAYTAEKNPTWTIAPTTLKGVVYYNSYGTKLAENFGGAKGGNGRFGGATLAIEGESFDPKQIAGSTSSDASGCSVCHVVSADGSRMIAQRDDNMLSSAYDLRNMNRETQYPDADRGKLGWAALSPEGSIALGNAGPPGSNSQNVANLSASALYRTSDATTLTANGLSSFVTQAATPVFSVDGKRVAFNLWSGPGNAQITANGRSLVLMDVTAIDANTYDFTNPRAVYTATGSDQRPGWPFFLPDGSGLVFQLELAAGSGNEHLATRKGARGELWWTDLEGHAHALDRANGKGYLPSADKGHNDDATLQYEPTVAPIVAGGYAWVVFTSRRSYGNVATRNPFESDPREHDLSAGNASGPTTKKLWVSALDVPAKVGSDPSHPAFYLPAQELYAGNSRGYWVLDACKADSQTCSSGDECCGGYCHVGEEFGVGTCMAVPPSICAKEYDKCNVDSDCCQTQTDALYCIAGRCAMAGPQ